MSDPADLAGPYIDQFTEAAIAAARGDIPQGQPGECEYCGDDSPRLINGVCARCRDAYNLP